MFADRRKDRRLKLLQGTYRPLFIFAHQPAVAGDVGSENGSQTPFHRSGFLCLYSGARDYLYSIGASAETGTRPA
jgi:hypothetical protein